MAAYRQSPLKQNLTVRARLCRSVRAHFVSHDYLEVETPLRVPSPAPEAHIDSTISDGWFLQTSPELCMKRLMAAGYPRLFQICRCFRQGERGTRHLPEFTMLEWYTAGYDYRGMMAQTEGLIQAAASDLGRGSVLAYQDERVDLAGPWPRMTVRWAFDTHGAVSMEEALASDRFDEVMAADIEPNLGRGKPVFLYDYPASRGALARLKQDDPQLAERFELYICGIELCNGFSELTDPREQRERFEREQSARRLSGKPVYPMPERFLDVLADMPEAGGNALGIDRLAMLFADAASIDDVVAYTPEEL